MHNPARQDSSDSHGAQLAPLAVDYEADDAFLRGVSSLSPTYKRPCDSDTGPTRLQTAHDETEANAQHALPELDEQDGHPGTPPQSDADSHEMSKQIVEQDNVYAQDNMPSHAGPFPGAARHFTCGQSGHDQYQEQQHMYAQPCQPVQPPVPQPVPQSTQHNINYAPQVNQTQTMQFVPAAPVMPGYGYVAPPPMVHGYYVHSQPQAFAQPAPSAQYYAQPVAMQPQVAHPPQSFVMAQPAQFPTMNPQMQQMPTPIRHMAQQYPTHTHMHMQAPPPQVYQNQAQAQSRPQQPTQQPAQPAAMADAEEKQGLAPHDRYIEGPEDNRQCILCPKGPFTSSAMETSHIQGKEHQQNKAWADNLPAHVRQRLLGSIQPAPRPYGRCDVCDVPYPTEAQSKSHLAGKKHKENERLHRLGLPIKKQKKKNKYNTALSRRPPSFRHNYERKMRESASPKVALKSGYADQYADNTSVSKPPVQSRSRPSGHQHQ